MGYYESSVKEILADVDWSDTLTLIVKDQGECQASWAFSATGMIEALYEILFGEISPSVSEQ